MKLLALFRRRELVADFGVQVLTRNEARIADLREVAHRHGILSMVATGMQINGNVLSKNGAAIDGTVRGNVCVLGPNNALLVRAGATVYGDVRAPIVMVAGTVHGAIIGRFVRLYPGSRILGSIRAERLIVDDGAVLHNQAMLTGPDPGDKPEDPVITLWSHPKNVALRSSTGVDASADQGSGNVGHVGTG